MKRIYQIFTLILAAFVMVACSDAKKDMQADIDAIEQVTEQSGTLQKIEQLQTQLVSGSLDKEQLKQIFTEVSAEYSKLKDSVASLKLKTEEGKNVQAKFDSAITKFISLMNQSAEYSTNPPTSEQASAFMQLQQDSTKELLDANNALIELKNKVAEKK
ncbi:hypothetical protein [Volucribacter amazonae]|uniref:Lipoprotein n=1 Tax=Volucribacter amazonae TaxID=256731 RepID=A0A9X4SL52_9PAST|nr:hypothetical protein [Volucribacter amazonae]MDG6894703.1 hypothetical protein [Volucribacter amazonae]